MSNFCFPYNRRWSRVAVLFATAVLILVVFPFNRSLVHCLLVYGRYPPLYPHNRELERELPHYQSYERSDVKYLWSPNHPTSMLNTRSVANLADRHCRGRMGKYNAGLHPKLCSRIRDQSLVSSLGHRLRESVFDTSPSFVFDDYTWTVDGTPYSHFNGKLIPSGIPLTALIDGKEHLILT